jgi:predicted NBD/HSP70 family sugar kinase
VFARSLREAIEAAGAAVNAKEVAKASIAICGPCDFTTGTFDRPSGKFAPCTGTALIPLVESRLGIPVEFHHDAMSHAVGSSLVFPSRTVLAAILGTGASLLVASDGACDTRLASQPGPGADGLSVTRFGSDALAAWAGTDPLGMPWWSPRRAVETGYETRTGVSLSARDVLTRAHTGDPDAASVLAELVGCWQLVFRSALDQVQVDAAAFGGGVACGARFDSVFAQSLSVETAWCGPEAALVGATRHLFQA